MTLLRGDLVTVAAKGPYTGKPRPALVIQANETLCLLTADLIDASLFRVRIEPDSANGLRQGSDVMADKVLTVPRSVVSAEPFGHLSRADLARVDEALRFWLGL